MMVDAELAEAMSQLRRDRRARPKCSKEMNGNLARSVAQCPGWKLSLKETLCMASNSCRLIADEVNARQS